jgi:hypothetical protein
MTLAQFITRKKTYLKVCAANAAYYARKEIEAAEAAEAEIARLRAELRRAEELYFSACCESEIVVTAFNKFIQLTAREG